MNKFMKQDKSWKKNIPIRSHRPAQLLVGSIIEIILKPKQCEHAGQLAMTKKQGRKSKSSQRRRVRTTDPLKLGVVQSEMRSLSSCRLKKGQFSHPDSLNCIWICICVCFVLNQNPKISEIAKTKSKTKTWPDRTSWRGGNEGKL